MRKTFTEVDACFLKLLLAIIFPIGVAWQVLEMFFYGEVQPRVVDDWVTLLWVAAMVFVYRWTKEQTIDRLCRPRRRDACHGCLLNPGPLASDSDWEMRLHSNGENMKTGEIWK